MTCPADLCKAGQRTCLLREAPLPYGLSSSAMIQRTLGEVSLCPQIAPDRVVKPRIVAKKISSIIFSATRECTDSIRSNHLLLKRF